MAEQPLIEELRNLTAQKAQLEIRFQALRAEYSAAADMLQKEADKVDDRVKAIQKVVTG